MIHPSSSISKEAELDSDVVVGPFCVIRGRVRLGAGCRLESHVSLGNENGIVECGKANTFSPGAVIGGPPQDLKYSGEPTKLIVGDNNQFRECTTVNTGTVGGGGVTKIGNNNLIMAYVHIAHDCILHDHIAVANCCQLAGHVLIEDHVKIGGVCCVNQFVRIGKHAYMAGDSAINKDILPFTIGKGRYAVMRATNKIGLERSGFEKEEIENINRAIRIFLKSSETQEEALEKISTECKNSPAIEYLVKFVKASERGLAR